MDLLQDIGLVNFLREFLRPDAETGKVQSLRKLLLALGHVPVSQLDMGGA